MSAAMRMYRNWLAKATCACGAPVAHVVGADELPIPVGVCEKCYKSGADPTLIALVQLGRYTRLLEPGFVVEPRRPKERPGDEKPPLKKDGARVSRRNIRRVSEYSYDVMAKYSVVKAAYPSGEPYRNISPEAWARICSAVDTLIKQVKEEWI